MKGALSGDVSSPAPTLSGAGAEPLIVTEASGSKITDESGREYIDWIGGYGASITGHRHPAIVEAVTRSASTLGLATRAELGFADELVERIGMVERIRFVASVTEAGMAAARIARAATGRTAILKFRGCYHGHSDQFLTHPQSGGSVFSQPMPGVAEQFVAETIVCEYNDLESVSEVLATRGNSVAAIFVEPVAANMGVVMPDPDFLLGLRELADLFGCVLVFDEVVTALRLGPGLAFGSDGPTPDLVMLGNAIGGGLPLAAVAGRADLIDLLSPTGDVLQSGTHAAHPASIAAGTAALKLLDTDAYKHLSGMVCALGHGIDGVVGRDAAVVMTPGMLSLHLTPTIPRNFSDASRADSEKFFRLNRALRREGVLIPPSMFGAWFPSIAHTSADVDATVEAFGRAWSSVGST